MRDLRALTSDGGGLGRVEQAQGHHRDRAELADVAKDDETRAQRSCDLGQARGRVTSHG
ncbi:MAG: hypothetical protein Q8O67_23635 [Deltaproteobacteria bacterium]|nr:hypothetical protein [Deltaproteobacteria bacterium]